MKNDILDRADELTDGEVSRRTKMLLFQKECLDKILAAIRKPLPLVSIGPSGIGGYCQKEIVKRS